MSIRFIFGRAGAGKTHFCLEAVRGHLRRDAVDGPPLIVLVPEQATLQTERALLTADITACHRAEVLSFQRLAHRVLDSSGAPQRQALSEPARAMVLRHLLQQRRSSLRYYRRVDRNAGFIDRLAVTITELIAEAVAPGDLSVQSPSADDPRQADKLHDLGLMYAAYLEYLGKERVDPSQYFELATERVPLCGWLRGAMLFMDGFASLSRRESMLLMAVARQCQSADIGVLLDPELVAPSGEKEASAAARLFRKTHETWLDMHEALVQEGLEIAEPVLLRPAVTPRFANNPALAALERNSFAVTNFFVPPSGTATQGIELTQWPTQRLEVQYAVSCIQRWVSDASPPWRYRDMAILVRDLEVYHDLLVGELSAHGIPFFIDRRRPIAHHPLIELLRGGILLASERFSMDAVRLVLKSGLLPMSRDAIDELENYLLAHGLVGSEAWFGSDWMHLRRDAYVRREQNHPSDEVAALARINTTRRQFADAIKRLAGILPGGMLSGAEWAELLRKWMAELQVGETLERWTAEATTAGELDLAAQHQQVLRDVPAFLTDLELALPETPIAMEEFGGILEQGLSRITLGLTPPTLDQVLIGAIERSRQPTLKGLILLGFNEGQFPRKQVEDSVLNDDDRAAMRARGLRVAPPARLQTLDESLLVYIAVTRASHQLVLTYAAAGADGKELRPSPFIADLRRACPDLEVVHRADPLRSGESWDVLNRRDLQTRLAMEMRMPPRKDHKGASAALWNALYERARPQLVDDRAARRAFAALAPIPPVRLTTHALRLPIFQADENTKKTALVSSISALESYAACPFQFFARHGLRLRPRQEAALAPVDIGQIRHAILEEFFDEVIATDRPLAGFSDTDIDVTLRESCRRAAKRMSGAGMVSHGRDAHALRGTHRELAILLRRQRELARVSRLATCATEVAFGFGSDGLPAWELTLGEGKPTLRLRGFIDRVDLGRVEGEWFGTVIDYKDSRDKRLDMNKVLHGLALQLPTYLVVLREHGLHLLDPRDRTDQTQIHPVAALFVNLAQPYTRKDRLDAKSNADDVPDDSQLEAESPTKPRGLINFEHRLVLDHSLQGGWSENYQIFTTKNAELGRLDQSDGVSPEMFTAVLGHVEKQLAVLAGRIVSGDFDVRPVRLGSYSPCTWCDMHAVCREEVGLTQVRYLPSMKRSAALTAME